MQIFQTLEVTKIGSNPTSLFIPRTPFLVRVFQTLEFTFLGSFTTSHFIPRTPVFVRVLQTLQVTIFGSISTSPFIPRTPVIARVCQTLQVTIIGSPFTSLFIPRTSVLRRCISNTRGDHYRQLQNKSLHTKDTRFRAKIEAILSFPSQPFVHKSVPSLQNTSLTPMIKSTSCQNLQS